MPLKPSLQVHYIQGLLVAEFWDCLRLDVGPLQQLRQKYEAHVTAKGRPELVVDLLGVAFAGSATLGHFVTMLRIARQHRGRIIFCNVDPTVQEIFRATRIEAMFSFVADRPAALASVLGPGGAAADGTTP